MQPPRQLLVMWFLVDGMKCDLVSPLERKDCGYDKISEADCRSRKCCWDNSIPNVNWCFYPANPTGNNHLTETTTTNSVSVLHPMARVNNSMRIQSTVSFRRKLVIGRESRDKSPP